LGKILRCTYARALWCSFFFQNFIEGLIPKYPEVFEGSGEPPGQHEYNFGKKWKSYSSIYQLAQGNLLRFDEVLGLPLEKALLFLAYEGDKFLLEQMKHKDMMKGFKK
jgi:hypothetical protein